MTEDNSVGSDEYMELIRRLGAEPFIVSNVGGGTVAEQGQRHDPEPGSTPAFARSLS